MNPDNNALNRTYFIGGAPRIGKSLLAYKLATQINGHVVSTEAIRNAAKKAAQNTEIPLFTMHKLQNLPTEKWLSLHLNSPEQVVAAQIEESKALWPALSSFVNSFVEDSVNHIVEGVGILPGLVAAMKYRPKHIYFIGNTNKDHLKSMVSYSSANSEQDWMAALNYSPEQLEGVANYVLAMSNYIKEEAHRYGFTYIEMGDDDFYKQLDEITAMIIKNPSV